VDWFPRASFTAVLLHGAILTGLANFPVSDAAAQPQRLAGGDGAAAVTTAGPVVAYAAGSLREAMQALQTAYAAERLAARPPSGATPTSTTARPAVRFLFGPSGKLRERIEAGEEAHLFASASPVHTERLLASGKLRSSNAFASNSLCVLARPGVAINEGNVIATLLDVNLKLGTSTPGADPSGDYTWEMFRKIDAVQPGAYARLDAKALKLVGAEINAADTKAPYADLLVGRRADVFVTYCTNARAAQREVPGISFVRVPDAYDIATSYTIGIATSAPNEAREFLRYVLSQRAQKVVGELGFSPPPQRCEQVEPALSAAHAAWSGKAVPLIAGAGAESKSVASPSIRIATRHAVTLQPAGALRFRHRAQGGVAGSFGGNMQFTAGETGRVEVFVDRRAWIDVVRLADDVSLAPTRGDRWLGCAGVGKNLGFLLQAGERYELRLSEVDSAQAAVLLMPMADSGSTKPAK